MRRWIFLIQFAGLVAAPHVARAQTSVFIPLDHWAMPLIEHLIRSGVIEDPDPMTRPLRRRAVTDALDSIDVNVHGEATQALLEELRAEFIRNDDGFHGGLDGFIDVGARSHGRRDPLFPEGDGGPFVKSGFQFWISQGPIAMSTGEFVSSNLDRDPDYKGTGDRDIRPWKRGQNGYASFETSHVEAVFGNFDRNWGPQGFHGLLFSNVPYSYDHFSVRIKTKYVWIETAVSQLEDVVDAAGETHQRYWIAHRATGHLTDWLKLWINQAILLSGPNRQLEPWALNPFRINHFSAIDRDREDGTNNTIEGAFWLRVGTTTLNGSLLIDDFAFFSSGGPSVPTRLAGTLVAEGSLGRQGSWSAGYTFVSNLAYRTLRPVETISRRDVGLGRNFSDYDQLTVRATHPVSFGSLVGGELTFMRHGEGDFRKPWPLVSEYANTKFIHQGVSEKTLRLATTLNARPSNGFSIRGRAGVHFVRNAGNVQGATDTQFVGEIDVVKYFTIRF